MGWVLFLVFVGSTYILLSNMMELVWCAVGGKEPGFDVPNAIGAWIFFAVFFTVLELLF